MQGMRLITRPLVLAVLLLAGCGLNGGGGAGIGGRSSLEPSKMGPPESQVPTLEQYMAYEGPATTKVPSGDMSLDGHKVSCGARPTVVDPKLDSWGGAFPGYLILNPTMLKGLPTKVKLYVYYHECGHQFVGGSETGADCYSIQNGVRQGWLDNKGMDQICSFISTLKGDAVHPPGPERCQLMRTCYAAALKQQHRTASR
jgi:hypothetical protein